MAYATLGSTSELKPTLTYSEFEEAVAEGKVDHVTFMIGTYLLQVTYEDGTVETTNNLGYDGFLKDLKEMGVDDIRYVAVRNTQAVSTLLSTGVTLLVIYVIIKFFGRVFSQVTTIRSNTNEIDVVSKVTFDDVAGMTEEKEELKAAIESLKSSDKLEARGMKPIRGILLDGPPGVGKTLLAKAVAGEAGVNFLSYSGAEFNELYIGVGAMRVKEMFKRAEEFKPCVIFIDEIDNVGARRVAGASGGSRETDNTLTALLERMDGVGSSDGILFIGTTNRLDAIDPALLRPGRFDKIIRIGAPKTKEDREAIVRVHLKGKTLKEGVDVEKIGKLCFGLTGAEIAAALNDAVMESFRDGEDGIIDLHHIDSAIMKLHSKGVAKGKHTGKDLERVAVHEMGHALMNEHLGRKVVKVSVQPYSSGVGGVTVVDGESLGSLHLRTRQELIDDVKVLYAGMVAEQVVFGDISSGNSNDLERATQILHNMVASWGMVDGSIVSSQYLAKIHNITVSDTTLAKMEELGKSIKDEVLEFFSDPVVKERLVRLAKVLAEDEVIYELPE